MNTMSKVVPKKLQSFYTNLNVDRCFLIEDSTIKNILNKNLNDDTSFIYYNFYACYHLENNVKSGYLGFNKVNYNENNNFDINILKDFNKSKVLNYGILDIKFNEINSSIYSSNSDGSISQFDIKEFYIEKDYIPNNNLISDNNCSNTLEFTLDKNNLIVGFNEGNLNIIDLSSNKKLFSNEKKVHEYGIWALCCINNNIFLSGADDNTICLNDIRDKKLIVSKNTAHSGGINHVNNFFENENIYLSGSYDECISLFDIRKINSSLYKQKLNCAVWDVKQIKTKSNRHIINVASIYEGFNVFDVTYSINNNKLFNDISFNTLNRYNFHNSIVYGVDSRLHDNKVIVNSCSLYDNFIAYWSYDLDN